MKSLNKLKKLSKAKPNSPEIRAALLGDTATQLLAAAITGASADKGMNLNIYEAEYDQIFSEIIDDSSRLYSFKPEYVIIYMSSEKLYDKFCQTPLPDRAGFADAQMANLKGQWDKINSVIRTRIIQMNFAENDDRAFGNFGSKTEFSYIFQLRKLNYLMEEQAAADKNLYISDLSGIQNIYGRETLFSDKYYYSARLAVSVEGLPMLATGIADIISALSGKFKKCVVLDLDNTLWGGVIGDDGIDNIQIGELGTGRAFSDFQKWLTELKNRGILLAVCSKNNEDAAKEPFEKHPEMVLRLSDFAIFVANWNDKASNIKYIQQTLNIGMDSMVFIDDNPFERNLVREMIPEITVPELPEDPALYLSFLKKENLFETGSYSAGDSDRTQQYRAEAQRVQLQQSFGSIDDYLQSLEMTGKAAPFDSFNIPRISQLTQRSNQFNLRTVRYTEGEIADIAASDNYITLYFTLKDKFGDHGLISVVILEKQENDLFIDTWLMSCRVLKRTAEEFIINTVVRTAKEKGFSRITGEYIPTAKNKMVADIYEKLGFSPVGENRFEVFTDSFKSNKCFIKNENEGE